MTTERPMTTATASAYLKARAGVGTVATLKYWRRCCPDSPRFVKRGARVFYYKSDLDEFIAGLPI